MPWAVCCLAAPGPPVRLVFPEVRLTSVRIVWQPPEEPNGIILGKTGVKGWRSEQATAEGFSFALHISKSLAEKKKMCCCQSRGLWWGDKSSVGFPEPEFGVGQGPVSECHLSSHLRLLVTCLADCWENCLETWIFPTFARHAQGFSFICASVLLLPSDNMSDRS